MEEFDLRGLKCPLPALMARRKLAALAPGETVWVLASDPLSVVDIPHMCGEEGHVLIEQERTADHHRFLIRRDEMRSR
jgi:tRNA 2-thiouridine synthesizing protein A